MGIRLLLSYLHLHLISQTIRSHTLFLSNSIESYVARKNHSTTEPLFDKKTDRRLEKYRDDNGYSAAVLMDLSKVFDTLNHNLLLAKLHAYGIGINSLKLIMSYLKST